MASRIVIEEPCEHGLTFQHHAPTPEDRLDFRPMGDSCPGGSRRVLTEGEYVLIEKVDGEWPLDDGLVTVRYADYRSRTRTIHEFLDALAGGES